MKIAAFIDGANLYAASKALAFDIDYLRLLAFLRTKGSLVRAHYYATVIENDGVSVLQPLIDWLEYNGYTLITKNAKEYIVDGRRKIKASMAVEIAVDMMAIADRVDQIILFSGDGDFRAAVEAVQSKGVRVTVLSTLKTSPPQAADEMRRQADDFIDLADIIELINKKPKEPTNEKLTLTSSRRTAS